MPLSVGDIQKHDIASVEASTGMEAHPGLNPEDAGSTSALRELARRKFLDFLDTYSEADNDFSRSQETHESQQAEPTQPSKIYIEQVCYKMIYVGRTFRMIPARALFQIDYICTQESMRIIHLCCNFVCECSVHGRLQEVISVLQVLLMPCRCEKAPCIFMRVCLPCAGSGAHPIGHPSSGLPACGVF